jgi:hypothetical protein
MQAWQISFSRLYILINGIKVCEGNAMHFHQHFIGLLLVSWRNLFWQSKVGTPNAELYFVIFDVIRGKEYIPHFTIPWWLESENYESLNYNKNIGSLELVKVWISYNSVETFQLKYRFTSQSCCQGIMWWAVDLIQDALDFLFVFLIYYSWSWEKRRR